jgi:hypothetical protein
LFNGPSDVDHSGGVELDVVGLERDQFATVEAGAVAEVLGNDPAAVPEALDGVEERGTCWSVGSEDRGTYTNVVPWMAAVLA